MIKATLKEPFVVIQWHGEDYPCYDEDIEEGTWNKGEIVEIIKEVQPNETGKLYAIYSARLNESTVVYEGLLDIIEEN